MVTMFISFLVERAEQGILDTVDRYAERELAHRFERTGAEGGEFVEVVRRNTDVLVRATAQLVQQQAALWAQTLEETERRHAAADRGQQERLTAALEAALEKTLETHSRRLVMLEKQVVEHCAGLVDRMASLTMAVRETGREQQTALVQMTQALSEQVKALMQVQDGETQLIRLQESLQQNLAALAGAGTFEQAVHSLTAAIHLLTARAASNSSGNRLNPPRLGAAA
jgi:hypothetical protein